jgi:hypothetical protein
LAVQVWNWFWNWWVFFFITFDGLKLIFFFYFFLFFKKIDFTFLNDHFIGINFLLLK